MRQRASDIHRTIADPARILVRLSPQFDLCYALAELVAPEPRISARALGLDSLPSEWLVPARAFGWAFWLALPDALDDSPPAETVGAFIAAIAALPPAQMAERIRRGLFHSDSAERPAARKREWLHFVGLDDDRSGVAGPGSVDPAAVVQVLDAFSKHFEPVWTGLLPGLAASARDIEATAASRSFGEIAQALHLPLDRDGRRKRWRALRGGWSIAEADVGMVYLIPSAFNPRRLFHAADERHPAILYFPYQAIDVATLGLEAPAPVDPWLVSRALGDPTRAAIVRRLAGGPLTASELLQDLGLSKATVSHHIFHLREAGLIDERRSGKSIILSLRRSTLDALSDSFRRELGK